MTRPPAPGPEYAWEDGLLVHQPSRARLQTLGLTSLEAAFALPAEQRSRFKALARLGPAGQRVFVKRWSFDPREIWLRGLLKGANFPVFSGLRELENLVRLRGAGLRVPLPLVAGELEEGRQRRSFVALDQLAGQPLEQLAPPGQPQARRALLLELAGLVRRLHEAGCWHKDLYLCNVFRDPAQGLGLLDCERVEQDPQGVPHRWRVKDLAALDSSAAGYTCADRLRFLRAYLGQQGRLDPAARELAREVRRKAQRLARHGAKGA